MAWLVQPVARLTYPLDRQGTQALVISTLTKQGIAVQQNESPPEIVASCLTLCMNLGLWRCWSERLEFTLGKLGPTDTSVTINAIPALLRLGVQAREHVIDLDALVWALRST
jgi:hypothetical protein